MTAPNVHRGLAVLAAAVLLLGGLLVTWSFLRREPSVESAASGQRVEPSEQVAAPVLATERAEVAADAGAEVAVAVSSEPVPDGKIRITGEVVDLAWPPLGWPEELPVGLQVSVQVPGDEELETSTVASGRFEVLVDDTGRRPLFVLASVEGDERRARANGRAQLGEGERTADLRLERRPHGELTGRVVDTEDGPLAGVHVAFMRGSHPLHEAISDAQGAFSIPWFEGGLVEVSAELPVYTLLCWTTLGRAAAGGWEPLVVTMARSGALEVLVQGAGGEAAEGVTVSIGLADVVPSREQELLWADAPRSSTWERRDGRQRFHLERGEKTGADGLARFPEVWAERRLLVVLSGVGRWLTAERQVRGELVFDEENASGEAIHVPAGGSLSLWTQPFGMRVHVQGLVSYADGRPVARAPVEVTAPGRTASETFTGRARTASDGHFELDLADVRMGETIRVYADDGSPYRSRSASQHGGVDLVVTGTELRADVVLEPVLAISGRVLDVQGQPIRGWLNAVPEPPQHPAAATIQAGLDEDGAFEVGGLAPGTYELVLFPSVPIGVVRQGFPGILAGTSGIALVMDVPLDVDLDVRFEAPRAVGDYGLLVATWLGTEAGPDSWPSAGTSARVTRVDWPDGACLDCTGGMPSTVAGTPMRSSVCRGKGRDVALPHRFEGLPRGVMAVGIDARDEDGRFFAPVMAAPARYEAGRHELTFVLVPSASLRARVLGIDSSLALALEVLDEDGRPLPLLGQDFSVAPSMEIPADGRFELKRLPAGEVILRVGTREALEHGGQVLEEAVELVADETATVELDWR